MNAGIPELPSTENVTLFFPSGVEDLELDPECVISSYIEQGSNIKVVEIRENTIMVRKWFE